MNILEKIITHKKKEVEILKQNFKDFDLRRSEKNFLEALGRDKSSFLRINIISEIKRASPSKGNIFLDADILEIAKIYEKNGASAISCLTDEAFFSGSLDDLQEISENIGIPVLRKDFIIDEVQIYEARKFGADAILLMTSVLKDVIVLQKFRKTAEKLGMHVLVETHDEAEIRIALESGAKIIGVNSRDFKDLSIDLNRLPKLLQKIPKEIIKVAESGIYTLEDVKKVAPFCDAVLVGTSLMSAGVENIGKKIQEFKNI